MTMEQGDGYCDDVCACDRCRSLVEADVLSLADDADLLLRQQLAIDDLVSIAGYLPEAYAILAKHGLR